MKCTFPHVWKGFHGDAFRSRGKRKGQRISPLREKQERQKKEEDAIPPPLESESEKEIFVISDSFIARVGGPK